jgi:hypothetical protein
MKGEVEFFGINHYTCSAVPDFVAVAKGKGAWYGSHYCEVAMRKKILFILLALCLAEVTGCVSIPREKLSYAIEIRELSDHVHFLAQPALKGRKPKSWESTTVRKYLKSRFVAYGLVPWANRKGYELPFGFGTNVIGVLPGSDPNLAKEIVILAAHYDHLGKGKKGIYHGACDNASGVAALLEIAEHLSISPDRPKRSICFASFDCEEKFTLGSFAFTCRKDFEKQEIAAMVNVDLLGRDFLDVVEDSLFVVGTEAYPGLRTEMLRAGEKNGIKVLPIGTDIVGPRGDHVAFETMDMPVLFFSCGLYKDYHKPTDTAEKLNYMRMKNSAKVIAQTIETLANTERIEKLLPQKNGDKDELQTFAYILEKVNSNYEEAGLSAEQFEKLGQLTEETQRMLDNETYTVKQRRSFVKKAIKALLPALAVADESFAENSGWYLLMNDIYADHSGLIIEWCRDIVQQILESKPRLFHTVNLKYRMYAVSDDGLSFVEKQDGQYQLDLILMKVHLNYQIKGLLLKSGRFEFGFGHSITGFVGTKNQVTDYCLLQWRKNLTDESYSQTWGHILNVVTDQQHGTTYEDWSRWRLQKQGLADEKQWLLNLCKSDNRLLASIAAGKQPETDSRTSKRLQAIIRDPNTLPDARTKAVWDLNDTSRKGLLTLVEILDDKTPSAGHRVSPRFMDESYPLANHRTVIEARKWWKEQQEEKTPLTIGDDAETKLKLLTNKDFGKDARAWRKWIKANVK